MEGRPRPNEAPPKSGYKMPVISLLNFIKYTRQLMITVNTQMRKYDSFGIFSEKIAANKLNIITEK